MGCPSTTTAALWELVLDAPGRLSWAIILAQRDAFSQSFDGFNPDKMSLDARRIARSSRSGHRAQQAEGQSAIGNARAFLR